MDDRVPQPGERLQILVIIADNRISWPQFAQQLDERPFFARELLQFMMNFVNGSFESF
ncbi:hypothetical protein D3C84_1169380 [compost metagenome]